ncbi:MAG: ATP-binding protein [Gemmatimonadales bacterium]|nr:MAG: ATP-binding protein [Gemmatimonadales bacterium]
MNTIEPYAWPRIGDFIGRDGELARLESWWGASERMPVNLYGRRRVGKSWLFRRFAHEKPAILLVAERLAEGTQLTRFAEQLAPALGGVTPDLPDVAALFRVLYRLARDEKVLAVIDEFPWLLGTSERAVEQNLSAVQAVMEEERDRSQLKLVVCGSAIAQMEALQSEKNPLHGRLVPLELRALPYGRAIEFLENEDPLDRFTRYAIAGGMPRYLAALSGGTLEDRVCDQMLKPDAPLWNEGRTIVGQELREPAVYFSLLEQLASGEKEVGELASAIRKGSAPVAKYLSQLEDLRLVKRDLPYGASATDRRGRWVLVDPFLRFWFRFVFPFQADLEAGLSAEDLYRSEIGPELAHHVSPVFEGACREHVRSTMGAQATRVDRWWGIALNSFRKTGERSTEEIDVVGSVRKRVTVVGEVKWTTRPAGERLLHDLHTYKIPALQQAGIKLAGNPVVVLFSRSGYTPELVRQAGENDDLVLVDVAAMLSTHK